MKGDHHKKGIHQHETPLQQLLGKKVVWKDLLPLTTFDTVRELALPLPWLLASWVFAERSVWILALGCSFFFFLGSLRVVHNAYHHALGLSIMGDQVVMLVLSPLMFCSNHAVQFNHHRHHRYCMDEGGQDVEGSIAKKSAIQALITGPIFPFKINKTAWCLGDPVLKVWLVVEWSLLVILVSLTTCVFPESTALRYHISVTALGQALGAFFCVWTVHHDCEEDHPKSGQDAPSSNSTTSTRSRRIAPNARTSRKPWVNCFSMSMFYHAEHHLFPRVPTSKLHILADRLDKVEEFKISGHKQVL